MNITLDAQQAEVVTADDARILCLAGAGTGKTQTLISKILHLVDSGIKPRNILALTFTRAASMEFQTRYKIELGRDSDTLMFSTFHGFCYQLIQTYDAIREKLGYTAIPEVLTDAQDVEYKKRAQKQSRVKLPLKYVTRRYTPTRRQEFEYQVALRTYDKLLVADNVISFDKMCYDVCKLFVDKDPCVAWLASKYTHIFVDEFQDTDCLQWNFVKSFENASLIYVCGDVRQAIYGFRGADSSIIKALAADDNWATYKLETNYRSTIEICEYANKFLNHYHDDLPKLELKSSRHGPTLRHTTTADFESNVNVLAADTSRSKAIVFRTNEEVDTFGDLLFRRGIPFEVNIEELPSDSDYLYIGTIHSVKGLEFDSVYVGGVNSKHFNVLRDEETMNLYYVACTRAKNLLTIITDR